MTTATVVGSGPNGLAAAVVLARAGVRVTVLEAEDEPGGGLRSVTVDGLTHDVCSAVHPFGAASPFLRTLDLDWSWPELDLAHPLDGGSAAVLQRDLAATAAGLGADGRRWQRLFGPLAAHFDALAGEILRPILHLPRHPLLLARFGVPALAAATLVANRFDEAPTQALFAGMAAHAFRPLHAPTTASFGLVLGASGHAIGWPVARGGSGAIAAALIAELERHGGTVETGRRVTDVRDLEADVTLLDVAPDAAVRMARLPWRVRRAYRRFRRGPAAYKLELAVEDGVPWTNEACRRAGTVHVGGELEEIAAAEADVNAGRMPERPFVLVAQQYLADPSRSRGDVHPLYAYAHVPHGFTGDATPAILDQLERFAPGLRERIVGTTVRTPADIAARNANFVGGDITTGAQDPVQVLFRPRVAPDPYATGVPGLYLCSAATPPGGGVHGMCGVNAARAALRHLARR